MPLSMSRKVDAHVMQNLFNTPQCQCLSQSDFANTQAHKRCRLLKANHSPSKTHCNDDSRHAKQK